MIYHLALYRGIRDSALVETWAGTWKQLVKRFQQPPRVCATKDERDRNAELFVPAILHPGRTTRRNDSVRALTLAVFDYDQGTTTEQYESDDLLQAAGVSRIWYPSYSYPDKNAWRLILPLSEPISATGWKHLRAELIQRFALRVEEDKCSGIAHGYFAPVARLESVSSWVSFAPGKPLDVSNYAILYPVPTPGELPTAHDIPEAEPPERDVDFEALRTTLFLRAKKHHKNGANVKGLLLERIASGQDIRGGDVVSVSGDPPLVRAASLVIHAAPGYALSTYRALMGKSIETMRQAPGTALPESKVRRMIETGMERYEDYKEAEARIDRLLFGEIL